MSRRRANQLAGVAMVAALILAAYFSFHQSLPFTHGYRLHATVRSANQLHPGSPVRVAGVDVGKVSGVEQGPGNTTTLTMDIEPRGLPLHRDATIRIRPRVFLEGGFYVELAPGSPSSARLGSGGTIPLAQTTTPVQLSQLLTVFDAPVRHSLRDTLHEVATGLSGGGAAGLRAVAPQLAPTLRDLTWVAQAAQGTAPHDVSQLIAAGARVGGALARDPGALAGMITSFRQTTQALSADDRALGDSIAGADELMRSAPSGLRALGGALPVVERVSAQLRPALPVAPGALRRTTAVLGQLGALVAPGSRERTVAGLRTTFVALPGLIVRLAGLFPTIRPLSDCLRTHITPVLSQAVPDGALSTGHPAWQDFAHALVGLASASQNFDGDGYAIRYLAGVGPEGLSTAHLPGIGTLSTSVASPLQSRPLPLAGGGAPPVRTDVPCTSQPLPTLDTPAGGAGLAGSAP